MRHPYLEKFLKGLTFLLNGIFLSLTLFLLFVSLFKKEWATAAIAYVGEAILGFWNWNYLIAFASSIIESFPVIGVLVPGMNVMLLVWGFFGVGRLPEMIVVAAVGAIIGNYFWYVLGKRYGKAFFKNYGDVFGIGKVELRYLEKQIAKNGAWFVILWKFHNFTRAFVPFIAGSAGMKSGKFWMYNVIGSIIWASTIVTLGVAFAKHYETVVKYASHAMIGLLVAFALYVYFFKKEAFLRYWKEKQAELEEREKKSNK